jgi:hypothetical protein
MDEPKVAKDGQKEKTVELLKAAFWQLFTSPWRRRGTNSIAAHLAVMSGINFAICLQQRTISSCASKKEPASDMRAVSKSEITTPAKSLPRAQFRSKSGKVPNA